MSDEIRRQALVRDIARRLQLRSLLGVRVIDRALLTLERLAQGPEDEFGTTPLAVALLGVAVALEAEDQQRADLHEQARAEMLGAAAKVPVCATCRDTHRMMLRDREVMCTRCPVPCEACARSPGPYCATTPCLCACHATRSSTPVRVLSDEAEAPGEQGGEG